MNNEDEFKTKILELKDLPMDEEQTKGKKVSNLLIVFSLFLLPLSTSFYIVSLHSSDLINDYVSYFLLVVSTLSLLTLTIGIILKIKDKTQKSFTKTWKIILTIFFCFYFVGASTTVTLLYGPNEKFRDWLITTAMETLSHKYLATWFYNSAEIEKCMDNNQVIETGESTNTDLVAITKPNYNQDIYANKFEAEILSKESEDQVYKIIDIDRDGMRGKLAVVYDMSKFKLITSKYMGTNNDTCKGQYLTEMSKEQDVAVAINASGFIDPGYNSWGGVPQGLVIVDGKLLVNNRRYRSNGGVIGITYDNKLVLSNMTANQALQANLKYAIQWGPFLIVNGVSSYIKGNGGGGNAPRSAIGQRADGIMLLLVIDGRNRTHSRGASMADMAEIMSDYGAINAANLDGGTSSAMVENGALITIPINGSYRVGTRPVPNAWAIMN